MQDKILILNEKPPVSYVNALNLIGLNFDCRFYADDLSEYKGLLLIGGGDICPVLHGGKTNSKNINLPRDITELNTMNYFVERNLPILGICRGMQIIGTYFGVQLKDVSMHLSNVDIYHKIRSYGYLKSIDEVNSSHHQVLKTVPPSFSITATSYDGEIEGIIKDNIIGVQFHPERMSEKAIKTVYGLFAKFVYAI